MELPRKTILYEHHVRLEAKIMAFGGWKMPLEYSQGIVQEHMATRKGAGLFDVSHMGRFILRGSNALPFLQYVLTHNAAALEVGQSHYTIVPNNRGTAIDDAYLYRFFENEYLLVVNAANRESVWTHFQSAARTFNDLEIVDHTMDLAMMSLQGPESRQILTSLIHSGKLPEPRRNSLSVVTMQHAEILLSRTGYTGEPIGFELFVSSDNAGTIWERLIEKGARPIGLGARDTLRLEAGLPLYGHELGTDPGGCEIPIFACPLSQFAVSFSSQKGNFIGREALEGQFFELKQIVHHQFRDVQILTKRIMPVALVDKGIARRGNPVLSANGPAGWITSGTMVPYWKTEGKGISSRLSEERGMRAIGFALLDSRLREGDSITVDIRGKKTAGMIVPCHLKSDVPPYARAIIWHPESFKFSREDPIDSRTMPPVRSLLRDTIRNTAWRQKTCINLIPSEQTPSRLTRMLSIMDPAGRYAEHRRIKAFEEADVFYYQGTDFISKVENLLQNELKSYLECNALELRTISGQMANVTVFSALVDYVNRADKKSEPRRLRKVMNHHIIKGGHLSAQPMGALKDFLARDPITEKPAIVNFPVLKDNPYQVDVHACRQIIDEHRPELIIMGKSMTLHKEPVAPLRDIIEEIGLDCILMYDMAHVLGLVGPYFQKPFTEGADLVTASTHKTFFGTQRGIVAGNYREWDYDYSLWEAIERRTFPGSVSNHHLGSLLGLLMAAYEMNYFKNEYQKAVIENAKAFAMALKETGLNVAGDPKISFTETHQVILEVGYAAAPEVARRLEDNHIIVNYQAGPDEEGFTASGSLRMGVSEMTRFGMGPKDFRELSGLIYDVVITGKTVRDEIVALRKQFLEMKYCFAESDFEDLVQQLHRLL